jgi:hypothetical protein
MPFSMRSALFSIALAVSLLSAPAFAQSHRVPLPKKFPIGGTAPSGAHLKLPADLARRIARWPTVEFPFRSRGLTPRQLKMIAKLVDAARQIDAIYWRQSDPYALTLAAQLKGSGAARDQQVVRYLSINGGQYDLLDGLRSFINGDPAPAGRGFYSEGENPGATVDAARQSIQSYVEAHPESRAELFSPYTLVRPMGADLVGLPYRTLFRAQLMEAAKDLRDAAALASALASAQSDDAAFAEFLRARADALLTDDYQASDRLWLSLKQPTLDLILAPGLPNLDPLFGVKTSFGAAILLRNDVANDEESRQLGLLQPHLAQIQQSLPLPAASRPELPPTTLEIVDSPFRAGALLHGYQTLAFTLSDPQGSRTIFFRDLIDARFQRVIPSVAHKLMDASQSALPTAGGYFTTIVLQEIGREIGPSADRSSFGPIFPALEEAKAHAAGMYATAWLLDHGVLPREREHELYACALAELLRALLPYSAQAESAPPSAPLAEFNYLFGQSAIVAHAGSLSRGTAPVVFAFAFDRLPAAVAALNRELLEIEASGDRSRAEQWFARYATPSPALRTALESSRNLPVDIAPKFSWDLPMK